MKILAALATAVERLFSDPGSKPVAIKTGQVIIAPFDQHQAVTAFVAARDGTVLPADFPGVPPERVRTVAPGIEERWTAVPANLDHLEIHEIAKLTANGAVPIGGWRVAWVEKKQNDRFMFMSAEQIREHVLSLSIAPEDDRLYNGYYATIKGNDIAHDGDRMLKGRPSFDANGRMTHDGTIRGGTEIRGGRAEYKRKTKGYEQFGKGWFDAVDKIKAAKAAERQRATDTQLAKIDAKLPRKIGEL